VCVLALGFMAMAALRHVTGVRDGRDARQHDPEAAKTYLEA
jgi:hypothetical protein